MGWATRKEVKIEPDELWNDIEAPEKPVKKKRSKDERNAIKRAYERLYGVRCSQCKMQYKGKFCKNCYIA